MTWDCSLYPKDWKQIATTIKNEAGWRCENCDRPCRLPNESKDDFLVRISETIWLANAFDFNGNLKIGRFTLTVAHLDHSPENCSRSNLRALCSVCHCQMDLRAIPLKRYLKRERDGQLRFVFPSGGRQ